MLKVLARKIGLTENELRILVFFLLLYLGGLAIKNFSEEKTEPEKFDYSEIDRLYESLNADSSATDSIENESISTNKSGKQKNKFANHESAKVKIELKENSIDINTATLEIFMELPGIGMRTAENIIAYRLKIGRFKSLSELLNVKGIGQSRLENIKKYIYIDAPNIKR